MFYFRILELQTSNFSIFVMITSVRSCTAEMFSGHENVCEESYDHIKV